MSYLWVDDKAHSDPRVLAAGNGAWGLLIRCGDWSCDLLTDGHIPLAIARNYGTAMEAKRLVDTGLWQRVDDGFVIPGFTVRGEHLLHGIPRTKVLDDRANAAARQRRHRGRTDEVTDVSRRDFARSSATPDPYPDPPSTSHDNDDSESRALHPSSSSIWTSEPDLAAALALIARALRIAHTPPPRKPLSWERGTFTNLVAERADEIRQRLTAGEQPIDIAATAAGGLAYARRAWRELHPEAGAL